MISWGSFSNKKKEGRGKLGLIYGGKESLPENLRANSYIFIILACERLLY